VSHAKVCVFTLLIQVRPMVNAFFLFFLTLLINTKLRRFGFVLLPYVLSLLSALPSTSPFCHSPQNFLLLLLSETKLHTSGATTLFFCISFSLSETNFKNPKNV